MSSQQDQRCCSLFPAFRVHRRGSVRVPKKQGRSFGRIWFGFNESFGTLFASTAHRVLREAWPTRNAERSYAEKQGFSFGTVGRSFSILAQFWHSRARGL